MRFAVKIQMFWVYAGELLLTGLICWLMVHQFGTKAIREFIFETAQQWSTLVDYLFAASVGIWVAVLASIFLTSTSFGSYLRSQGAIGVYLSATATPVGVLLATDIAVKMIAVYKLPWLSYAAFILLLYSLLNFLTLVKNVVELVSFYLAYQALRTGTRTPPNEAR